MKKTRTTTQKLQLAVLITFYGTRWMCRDNGAIDAPFHPMSEQDLKKLRLDGLPDAYVQKALWKKFKHQKPQIWARFTKVPSNVKLRKMLKLERGGGLRLAYRSAAFLLLRILDVFPLRTTGKAILGVLLTANATTVLRQQIPDFRPHICIAEESESSLVSDLFTCITQACVRRRKWKGTNCVLHREALLDCRRTGSFSSFRFIDFNYLKLWKKEYRAFLSVPYRDTVVTVIGADGTSLINELLPFLDDAAVFFLGCKMPSRYKPPRLDCGTLDSDVVAFMDEIHECGDGIAGLLRCYSDACDSTWASEIRSTCHKSLLSSSSSSVAVDMSFERVQCTVFDSVTSNFLDFLEHFQILSMEECDVYRARISGEILPGTGQNLLAPDVFLSLVRGYVDAHPERFVNRQLTHSDEKNGFIGSWRNLGQGRDAEEYLVFDQAVLEKHLFDMASEIGNIDPSSFEGPDWFKTLLNRLKDYDSLLKVDKGACYYRYPLYSDKSERCHTVAIRKRKIYPPAEQLEQGGDADA